MNYHVLYFHPVNTCFHNKIKCFLGDLNDMSAKTVTQLGILLSASDPSLDLYEWISFQNSIRCYWKPWFCAIKTTIWDEPNDTSVSISSLMAMSCSSSASWIIQDSVLALTVTSHGTRRFSWWGYSRSQMYRIHRQRQSRSNIRMSLSSVDSHSTTFHLHLPLSGYNP